LREIKVRSTVEEIKIGNRVFEMDLSYDAIKDIGQYVPKVKEILVKLDKKDVEVNEILPVLHDMVNKLLIGGEYLYAECNNDPLTYVQVVFALVKEAGSLIKLAGGRGKAKPVIAAETAE
jgi:hypothetical protein